MKTYTYYVYLIPGIKIGCTTQIEKRMLDQGFTQWEILWQQEGDYDFGWIAGDKEKELQELHGYKVDKNHYQFSRMNRPVFTNETRTIREFTFIERSKGGKTNVESGKLANARLIAKESGAFAKGGIRGGEVASNIIRECPHCNKQCKGPSYFRHEKHCKLKQN